MGDRPVQRRVVQGKEPLHFRQLFKGKMVIHQGGKASGFKNTKEQDNYDEDGVSLFHVKGTNELNTVAVQVEEKAASLNSGDCFVLLTPTTMYSWNGSGSSEVEQKTAAEIADLLSDVPPMKEGLKDRELATATEGSEPEEFWAAIGGKGEYPKLREGEPAPADPRLFQASTMTGCFSVEEIFNFTQEDLIDDDVMLLDVVTSVYVWVGSNASEEEKAKAVQTAADYNAQATDGRDADTAVMEIKCGNEPAMFTTNFVGWDAELFTKNKFEDPYEKRLRELAEAKEKVAAAAAAEDAKAAEAKAAEDAAAAKVAEAASGSCFTLEELQAGVPDGVDAGKKETYLSDADFQTHFGMDKAAFAKMPGWKAKGVKSKLKLF
jgi:advillin